MVPHYSVRANSKSDESQKSADILTENREFLGKLPQINRARHYPQNTTQSHRLPALARLCGLQWRQSLCFNAGKYPRRPTRSPQYQWCLGCASCEDTYNKLINNLTSTSYSAVGTHYPAGDHAHECGTMQPGQLNQEPQFNRSSQAELLIQRHLKCKQPSPPDGCLAPKPNHTAFMLVRYR